MDARRLGMGVGLPQGFLAAAAPRYLTDTEWDGLGVSWENVLQEAWDYAAVPCKGVRGPLTRIPPSRPAMTHPAADGQPPAGQAGGTGGPLYRLADYLDQHGRQHRKGQIPPAGFWAAAADYVSSAYQAALGDAADARVCTGTPPSCKNAAAAGNLRAVSYLSGRPPCLRDDARPVRWAVAHAALDDPGAVAELLRKLREAGAQDQATALLDRDPAARISLDNPGDVARLLGKLREAGAKDQVTALASRAAPYVPLGDPIGVARLLESLWEAGAQNQVTALADRAIPHLSLDDPSAVTALLGSLRAARARDQIIALLDRDPAASVSLDDPRAAAWLLESLLEVGAGKQATLLTGRAAAHAPLGDPHVVILLGVLWRAGAKDQVTTLLRRDPAARVPLDDPRPPVWPLPLKSLLEGLQAAGAREQATALAERLPGAGMFYLFLQQQGRQDRFRFGREADGSPAEPWDWEDLG